MKPVAVFDENAYQGGVFHVSGERSARQQAATALCVGDGESVRAVFGLYQYRVGRLYLFKRDLACRPARRGRNAIIPGFVITPRKTGPTSAAESRPLPGYCVTRRASQIQVQVRQSLIDDHNVLR